MRPYYTGLLIGLSSLFITSVYAWWDIGHMTVAHIASQQLNVPATGKVNQLIREFQKVHPEVNSLERMALWLDELHGKQHVYLYFHWHFIDVPINLENRPIENITDPDNGVWALEHIIESLKMKPISLYEQSRLLAFLVHIVGDLHQPLHNVTWVSSTHPKGDQGGNEYFVMYNGKSINLHQLWDSGFGVLTGSNSMEHITQLSDNLMIRYPLSYFGNRVDNLKPQSWSAEGMNHALHHVYTVVEFQTVNDAYLIQGTQLIEEQVTLAGYRLGSLLNELFRS